MNANEREFKKLKSSHSSKPLAGIQPLYNTRWMYPEHRTTKQPISFFIGVDWRSLAFRTTPTQPSHYQGREKAFAFSVSFLVLTLLLLSLATTSLHAATLPVYSTTYDPHRDAFADGRAAIQLATSTQRKVLIEVGGDWCSWCHILDQFLLDNPDLQQQLHSTFVFLKINVSDENSNREFLKAFPKPLGYPHMYITDSSGKILWSQDTAEFLKKGKYSREPMLAFINKWKKS